MMEQQIPIIMIGGATASGKTDLALRLAQHYAVEVVSADSRQVYRYMDIGTAKVSAAEQDQVPHHIIDVVDPDQDFSVADFADLAHRAIADIAGRGKIPLIVGGTGLYLRALSDGLIDAPSANDELRAALLERERNDSGCLYKQLLDVDEPLAQTLHPNDVTRIVRGLEVYMQGGVRLSQIQQQHAFSDKRYRTLKLAIDVDRATLYEHITRRVDIMIEQGLLQETRQLLDRGYDPQLKSLRTIGYRQSIANLCDGLPLDETIAMIQQESRRYAKRQLTWFRKDKTINWVDSNARFDSILKWIDEFYYN